MVDEALHIVISFNGNSIRLTMKQWLHIVENHDYMAGNIDKVLETIAEPVELITGRNGEVLALR